MVKHLENANDFENIIERKVLVDFYADWCGPCKRLAPILEELESIDVLKVNVDSFDEISRRYGIMSIPTLILFENGEEIKKSIGFKTKDEINEFIK